MGPQPLLGGLAGALEETEDAKDIPDVGDSNGD